MITIIRSITELMVITTSRENLKQNKFEKNIKDIKPSDNKEKSPIVIKTS